MRRPKIVLIGIGSHSFGVRTFQDLFRARELAGSEVWLVDINEKRLETMTALAKRFMAHTGVKFELHASAERRRALPEANYVISSIATARHEAWAKDRAIAEKYGIYQAQGECSGPGGLALAMRNIPPYLAIARDMEELCPDALLINFSNPEGRVVLAVSRYSKIRAIGLCHGLSGSLGGIAKMLGRSREELDAKAGGINHFNWITDLRFARTGEDAYPALRRAVRKLRKREDRLAFHLFELFGLYPVPGDRHLADFVPYAATRKEIKRYNIAVRPVSGRVIQKGYRDYSAFVERLASGEEPLEPVLNRPSGESAIPILQAHWFNENRFEIAVNLPNRGYINNLPNGAVVEVPALISGAGVQGVALGELPEPIAAIIRLQMTIQELAVDAAATGDKRKAVLALALDPMVGSLDLAERIVADLLKAHRRYLPQFFPKG